jgi:aspartyl-tRNA(Asn)/glutamyl-tRNA(Gln) amidotransferase subunit B
VNTAKDVISEMASKGGSAQDIVDAKGLKQISDPDEIAILVRNVIRDNPRQLSEYSRGKKAIAGWFFGQVMKAAKGKANPRIVRKILSEQLSGLSSGERKGS